ncbi:TPA: hypothetical protein DIU27_02475 [Candidatus Collierbacteria bacterium]|uniref:Uncharacterized protein n=1 Tax=Candidatus Collierbacteria bacterium GW2011_GWB2_44_22 TaxID=1618387 RepID=A0A0G1K5E0_9BACT|nr:MAG: hypothetical protein UW31_C0008G0023 [Candidatus Collierbacteria bacterium GW2011_GWA2_44_13]KKT50996.1 MAG: hypothetical protein UW42_C0010G0010 [Candidatus Collierbacteria bacterium GW2011_GWB1_44_197]KKT51512.1 MAG: hypothetical protein UW44_C0011G0023 [Candidatus Collierbacteria bacterium GW2011_GWB2_44_22]KKT62249.1 MAG: hypothetical protein UW56_C0009G0023 [Candidatus Collierbacteria bacterium GW2011_GWD1_44_27]KKT66790.1 MAG: hypothetical protein UW58_C0003G0023 [Candidatus Colli
MTDSDKKEMKNLVFGAVADALEEIVFPKFEKIDERFEKIDERFEKIDQNLAHLNEKVDNLSSAVEILDSDVGGVKMRLKVVENKLDGLIDSSLVVRDHERRISKLEKAIA